MNLQGKPKPWVRRAVRITGAVLWVVTIAGICLQLITLDKRVDQLESAPVKLEKVEVVITPEPTASPSAKLKKIVTPTTVEKE